MPQSTPGRGGDDLGPRCSERCTPFAPRRNVIRPHDSNHNRSHTVSRGTAASERRPVGPIALSSKSRETTKCAASDARSDPPKTCGFLAQSVFLRHTCRAGSLRASCIPSGSDERPSRARRHGQRAFDGAPRQAAFACEQPVLGAIGRRRPAINGSPGPPRRATFPRRTHRRERGRRRAGASPAPRPDRHRRGTRHRANRAPQPPCRNRGGARTTPGGTRSRLALARRRGVPRWRRGKAGCACWAGVATVRPACQRAARVLRVRFGRR